MDEWIVSVIKAMYEDASTKVWIIGRESKAFNVKIGVHQGSVLSPLLFIILLEALSRAVLLTLFFSRTTICCGKIMRPTQEKTTW